LFESVSPQKKKAETVEEWKWLKKDMSFDFSNWIANKPLFLPRDVMLAWYVPWPCVCLSVCPPVCLAYTDVLSKKREIYKSAKPQIFLRYDSAKKLLRKRNSDRYREPQQRFTKPQTGLSLSVLTAPAVSTPFRPTAGQCEPAGHV